jgi:hypothetical protein
MRIFKLSFINDLKDNKDVVNAFHESLQMVLELALDDVALKRTRFKGPEDYNTSIPH